MASDSTSRTLIILAALAVLAWCVWLIREVLPPFLIALALALLLDPLLDRMQRAGLPRALAVALTFAAFLAAFFGIIAFLVPRAVGQIAHLLGNLDDYTAHLEHSADAWVQSHSELMRTLHLPLSLADLWKTHQDDISGYLQLLVGGGFRSLQGSAGKLGWLVVVPIVTLYLMIDLDALTARLYHLISERHREVVVDLAVQVGRVFAAYLRGLMAVCAAFGGVVYLVLGGLFGLQYAIILALLATVLYAVPYLGQFTLLVVCTLAAWATGHPPGYVVGVAVAVLVVGQVFDQLITPRIIGRQVGLHPVLGLFALMVGNELFGLAGMVVAVPVAASLRVVLIHLFPRLAEPIPAAKCE